MSYRTPAEVLAVASQVLAVAAPELTPPRPVRRTGVEPRMIAVRDARGFEAGGDGQGPGQDGGPGGAARRWPRWHRAGWPSWRPSR